MSAVIGALTGVFGQAIREWYMRPRLDFKVRSKRVDSDGVIFKAYLVFHNKGRRSIMGPQISLIKYDDDGDVGSDYNFKLKRDINPGDHIFFEMGKVTTRPSLDVKTLGGETSA